MNCNRGCPYSGQNYTGPPWPSNWDRPLQVSQPHPNEDILTYAKRIKRELSDFEKEFKGEEKKDAKPKMRTFTLLETAGLLILAGPITAILYGKLIQSAITSLTIIPH